MNVVIIGNPKTNSEVLKSIAGKLTEAGLSVRYPTVEMLDLGEDSAIIETFERIDWADMVIAVPKEGLVFNHTITSEIAYAKHKQRPVFIYYG